MIRRAQQIASEHGMLALAKASLPFVHEKVDDLSLPLTNRYFDARYGQGESVLERDWDNLLLYDACRYDEFLRVCPFPTDAVERRVTLGSRTSQFLRRTFDGRTCHDVVYVTANAQTLRYDQERKDDPFHAIVSVVEEWDEETQTVPPGAVYEAALRAEEEYPSKRLVVHFLQPHAPFLGPTAEGSRERTGRTVKGLDPGREYTDIETQDIETTSYTDILRYDPELTVEDIRQAYRETLALATKYVVGLAGRLEGKTVVSSDHGELLGDRVHPLGCRRWEHPGNVRSSELCTCPWVELPATERKQTRPDPPVVGDVVAPEVVDHRLQSLGYLQ